MEQPPFPFALLGMVVLFGFLAISAEVLWIRIGAVVGAIILAAAAIYQSMPKRIGHDPIDDEPPE